MQVYYYIMYKQKCDFDINEKQTETTKCKYGIKVHYS